MTQSDSEIAILKTLWGKDKNGRWTVNGMKGINLKPKPAFEPDFFAFESEMELLSSSPGSRSIHEVFNSFGPTDFLLKQSIVPVVALAEGEDTIRCIGTAFIISCTGLVVTACHVLLDPQDRNYGRVSRIGNALRFLDGVSMGVLIPISPAYGQRGFRFFGFEECQYWGEWKESPLLHERERFDILTDIAICKIAAMPHGIAHQPLHLSLKGFRKDEQAYAVGYAEMKDIPIDRKDGKLIIRDFQQDLYVSVGKTLNAFPDNHQHKEVPTPGPCFDFSARVPGKMSGSPIFDGNGVVVRGVVSRSFSGEKHAFGAMLDPIMHLSLSGGTTLKDMMDSGNEGIAKIQGPGTSW